ncbi:hypothetical protein A7981_08735 [Methylovorus sp. MM2]|uniref:hypothetical protein n=1 Tax=Methylovorus sp. MM2 TaxID=1848038 RepID=UPI0007E1F237|nr:hypothetical protein [Methylovorus sp. MM2]OAM51557.1 hypothetical protein A7981_08735 [Methylovorus sp. MM2]
MRFILIAIVLLFSLIAQAEDENPLGSISGLSGNSTTSGVAVLPQNQINSRNRLSPVIVLPPESLESRTLVVPLPSEKSPPVVIRGNKSLETTPSLQPALPKSSISTGNKKPLQPIVD